MNWKKPLIEWMRDGMRFAVYACLIADAIFVSLFSVWFVFRFLVKSMRWCERVLFNTPDW